LNNRATQKILSQLISIINDLHNTDGGTNIRIATDFLYINNVRVVVDPQYFGPLIYITEEMQQRNIEEINFMLEMNVEELGLFIKYFSTEISEGDAFGILQQKLIDSNIKNINIVEWIEREKVLTQMNHETKDIREESNQVFYRAVLLMAEVLKSLEQKRIVPIRKAERLTRQIMNLIQVDESILVGLGSIKDFDEYTFAHSVNVCILSMLIGDRIKLSKGDLSSLGVAALLHDIGKTHIPGTLLNKPSELDAEEWEIMKRHAVYGVQELSKIHSLREFCDALFAALQHHVQFDLKGYPRLPADTKLLLFPRIVTLADYYDAMTTMRIYQKKTLTPTKAISVVLENSGTLFDPFLVKVFIQAIGIYPTGSVVELNTGQRAVVVKQNKQTHLMHRPIIRLLNDAGSADIDLTEQSQNGEGFCRSIIRSILDDRSEMQKAAHFLLTN
jgi:putative nucleotidyltransferase with HDIG domain